MAGPENPSDESDWGYETANPVRLREEPTHGYDLATELEISSGYVYRHLEELQDEGMITVHEDETEGRQRTTYRLTENGELLLEALGE